MRVAALIPARGGSERVPRKNLREINGESLVARSIRVCHEAKNVIDVFVSTRDIDIAMIASSNGAQVLIRSEKASSSTASLEDVINEHRLALACYDAILVVQCTSPFLAASTIDGMIEMLEKRQPKCTSVVCLHHDPGLWFLGQVSDTEEWIPNSRERPRTQDIKSMVAERGGPWLFLFDHYNGNRITDKPAAFIARNAYAWFDIDTEEDLSTANALDNLIVSQRERIAEMENQQHAATAREQPTESHVKPEPIDVFVDWINGKTISSADEESVVRSESARCFHALDSMVRAIRSVIMQYQNQAETLASSLDMGTHAFAQGIAQGKREAIVALDHVINAIIVTAFDGNKEDGTHDG